MPKFVYKGMSKEEQEKLTQVMCDRVESGVVVPKAGDDHPGNIAIAKKEHEEKLAKNQKAAAKKVEAMDAFKVIGDLAFEKNKPLEVPAAHPLLKKKIPTFVALGILHEVAGK